MAYYVCRLTRKFCDREKVQQLLLTSSSEIYLRFRGMSLRYFACVSLNSNRTEKESIYDKSRNVGETTKVEI